MSTDREQVVALVALVNATGIIPDATARQDYLAANAPAASVQLLPGARWASQYIGGGGIRETPFAVTYRTNGSDSAGRADAFSVLTDLADALEAATLTDTTWIAIRGEDTPVLTERSEKGSEVWRATFMLESKR